MNSPGAGAASCKTEDSGSIKMADCDHGSAMITTAGFPIHPVICHVEAGRGCAKAVHAATSHVATAAMNATYGACVTLKIRHAMGLRRVRARIGLFWWSSLDMVWPGAPKIMLFATLVPRRTPPMPMYVVVASGTPPKLGCKKSLWGRPGASKSQVGVQNLVI